MDFPLQVAPARALLNLWIVGRWTRRHPATSQDAPNL